MSAKEFTFWPNKGEDKFFKNQQSIEKLMHGHRDLIPQIIHEALQLEKRLEVYEAMKRINISEKDFLPIVRNIVIATIAMCAGHSVSLENGEAFVHDATDLVVRVIHDIPLSVTEEELRVRDIRIDLATESMMSSVRNGMKTYAAKMS